MVKIHRNQVFLIVIVPVIILFSALFTINWFDYMQPNDAINIDLSDTYNPIYPVEKVENIRIAVAAIISPTETFVYYQDLFNYISSKIGIPIELVQRKTYSEVNDLIESNDVDAAFICSRAYVEGNDQFNLPLLVVPIVQGEPYYHSYIIVPADSNITSLSELKGKTFAFTDPLSNSGKLSPEFLITQLGEIPSKFFRLTFFTYSHDKSIQAVAEGMVDAAAVDSLVWNYQNTSNPELVINTKIINISPKYGIPPVVVSKNIDPLVREQIKNILLHLHETIEGKKILENLKIDSFSEPDDKLYDSIRAMINEINDIRE